MKVNLTDGEQRDLLACSFSWAEGRGATGAAHERERKTKRRGKTLAVRAGGTTFSFSLVRAGRPVRFPFLLFFSLFNALSTVVQWLSY